MREGTVAASYKDFQNHLSNKIEGFDFPRTIWFSLMFRSEYYLSILFYFFESGPLHHVINCIVGSTPFESKFKDLSLHGMRFILNNLDHLFVHPMMEFLKFVTRFSITNSPFCLSRSMNHANRSHVLFLKHPGRTSPTRSISEHIGQSTVRDWRRIFIFKLTLLVFLDGWLIEMNFSRLLISWLLYIRSLVSQIHCIMLWTENDQWNWILVDS